MAYIDIDVTKNITTIDIGMQGENEAEGIRFDLTDWIEEYGSGSAYVYVRRNGDTQPYMKVMAITGKTATWLFTDADTAKAGNGRAQVLYEAGDVIKKSVWYRTVTAASEGEASGDEPDPYEDILGTARQILQKTQTSATAASVSASASAASARTSAEKAAESAAQVTSAQAAANEAKGYASAAGSVFKQVGNVAFVVNEDTSVTAIFTKEG